MLKFVESCDSSYNSIIQSTGYATTIGIRIYLVLWYQYNRYMYNDLVYSHTIHEENNIYKDHIELVNHLAVDALVRTSNHLAIF